MWFLDWDKLKHLHVKVVKQKKIGKKSIVWRQCDDILSFLEAGKVDVVVTQVPLHGIRLSQRELHQMNVPDVKAETQNASIRNDEGSASLVKSIEAQIASNWL